MNFTLGIDIGGTKIAAALVDDNGAVVTRGQRHTDAKRGGPAVLASAIELGRELTATATMTAIGIGAGGQIDSRRGVVLSATDVLPGWTGQPIAAAFRDAFGLPVAVDNDVNALAVGEHRFGAAKRYETVAFLALGTGVGGALLLSGVVHRGAHFTGGELGHLLIDNGADARRDTGGSIGTLEAYASGPGLIATYRELVGRDREALTGPKIAAEAHRDPDGAAAQAVTITGEHLGFGLASLANILDPDLFIIGGGLASLGELLLAPARRILAARALPGPATCPVVTASLGADASVIGAAALAMNPANFAQIEARF